MMLTLSQAAARLGVTRMTVYRHIKNGTLKAIWNIDRYEIDESALSEFAPGKPGKPKQVKPEENTK